MFKVTWQYNEVIRKDEFSVTKIFQTIDEVYAFRDGIVAYWKCNACNADGSSHEEGISCAGHIEDLVNDYLKIESIDQ